jgi:L-fuconolactonase
LEIFRPFIARLAVTIIDAHQHFWQRNLFAFDWLQAPDLAKINRDYLPADLVPWLARAGVQKTIFVQTQSNTAENDWVLKLAEEHDFIAGVVGWVDLQSEACEEQVLKYRQHPKFVGVRHVVQDEPDDDFIVSPATLRGLAVLERHGVPFDMLFFVKHLHHAATLAKKFPQLSLVLNHLSKPPIKAQQMEPWRTHFQRAARFPNVSCKLSGMITEADWQHWQPSDLAPFVQEALQAFGPQRLLFGSDWPVCELAGNYEQVYQAARKTLGDLPPTDLAAIFGGNAQRIYGLQCE